MSFSYQRLSRDEAEKSRQFPLLEPGIYNFRVKEAKFEMSNQGINRDPNKPSNPMIKLELSINDSDGIEHTIYDYLIETKRMGWKARHFCDAVGLSQEYDSLQFNEKLCLNRRGKASIIFQAGTRKPDGTYYKDKNAVEDYVMNDIGQTKSEIEKKKDEFFDDSIPF